MAANRPHSEKLKRGQTDYETAHLSRDQAPAGAVFMSELEVIEMQNRKLASVPLEKRRFLWVSQYIAMGSSIVTTAIINHHFRRKFHLGQYGAMATIPVLLLPAFFSRFADYYLTNKVLLLPACQSCLEVRSGAVNAVSVIIPSCLLSSVVSLSLSKRYYTYLIANNFQPDIKHALKTTPTHWMNLAILAAVSFGIAASLRHLQRKEIDNIMAKEEYGSLEKRI